MIKGFPTKLGLMTLCAAALTACSLVPTVQQPVQFSNLDPSVIGTVTRLDGTQQVTLDGWPLYRYLDDVVPGQVTGQGAGRTWYAVAPDGLKAGRGTPDPSRSSDAFQ